MNAEAGASTVLLIDDEPDFANLVKLILGCQCGDEVHIAPSAGEGLRIAAQAQPDFILVRIMMYEVNGYEVCRQLKAMPHLQGVPVLLHAAIDPKRVYPEAQRVGAAGYLQQPYGPQVLIAARDAVLRGDAYYPPLPEENDGQ